MVGGAVRVDKVTASLGVLTSIKLSCGGWWDEGVGAGATGEGGRERGLK